MRRIGMAAALVLLMGAAACSDSDGGGGGGEGASSAKGEEYVEVLAASMTQDGSSLSEEDADCTSKGMVDAIGVAELEKYGEPEDLEGPDSAFGEMALDEKRATGVYDAIDGCIGAKQFIVAGMEVDGEMSDEASKCVDENLGDDLVKEFIVALFRGELDEGSDVMNRYFEALMPCSEL